MRQGVTSIGSILKMRVVLVEMDFGAEAEAFHAGQNLANDVE
jgi:hypothetical protein